jgi:hypothetical protein
MLIACTSAARPFVRPFAFFFRPLTWMVSQFVVAADALGLSAVWQSTRARLIDPASHTLRSRVIDPVLCLSGRGLSFVASLLPASTAGSSPIVLRYVTRWPSFLLLGLLVFASPLRRFMSGAAQTRS